MEVNYMIHNETIDIEKLIRIRDIRTKTHEIAEMTEYPYVVRDIIGR